MQDDERTIATQKQYDELVETLNLRKHVNDLCKTMEEAGVIQVERPDQESSFANATEALEGSDSNQCYQIHPLFTLISRISNWGYDDEEHYNNMCSLRRCVSAIYNLSRCTALFLKIFIGGLGASEMWKSGLLQVPTSEKRSGVMGALQRTFKDIPSLIDALSWMSTDQPMVEANAKFWRSMPQLFGGAIHLVAAVFEIRKEALYPVSDALNGLYQKCLPFTHETPTLLDAPSFVYIVVFQAAALARMSSHRKGLPNPLIYLSEARDLIERHRDRLREGVKLEIAIENTLRDIYTFEANLRFLRGDREKSHAMQLAALSAPPSTHLPKDIRRSSLIPTLFQWLTQCKVRNNSFPTLH